MTTFTSNIGLVADPTGSNVGTWADNVTNPDFVAIDGFLGGVQSISVAATPVTLTAPGGFAPTPGAGPTQSQNRVLRFTGLLTANVMVTLPLPGAYIIENLTTGNFVLSFRGVTATEVVGTPQGERVEIYNDGANVRFVNLGRMGALELWGVLPALPIWVTACSVRPYLVADGTIYNVADFPALGARYSSVFGGNGITTFGLPDLRGRVPLAYDATGVRITVAGCGINGQTMGAALDQQTVTLGTSNLPPYTPTGGLNDTTASTDTILVNGNAAQNLQGGTNGFGWSNNPVVKTVKAALAWSANFAGVAQGGTSVPLNNVQPSQVTGVWVVKT